MSCTPGVRLPDRSRMFTRRWSTMCSDWHFRIPTVRISTAPQSRTEIVHLCYVYTIYTKLGRPVETCTTGVQLQDRSWMFTRPCQTICSKMHFHTAPVRICTAPRSRTRTAELGCVCTNYKKLVEPVVPCTPGVRHPDCSRMFTRRWRTICSERHFGIAIVRSCAAPLSRTGTAHFGYVNTTCTKLGGPIVPCTTGVRLPDSSRMFTRPWQTICSERHFRTAPVQICTAPLSRTLTGQLGCVHKLQKTGRARCTLFTRCTTPRPLTDVHQAMANTLQQKAFSYTSCTDWYGSQK